MKVCTLNVKGLASDEKRKDVLNWLYSQPFDIYCLQETHCSEQLKNEWKREWGGECFLTTFSSESRGSAILFKRNLGYNVNKSMIDPDGRYVLLEVNIDDKKILIGSVYAPNEDNSVFLKNLQEKVVDFEKTSVIIGGDWNVVLNYELDTYNYKKENNPLSRKTLLEFKDLFALEDIFRVLHPDAKQYTWSRRNPTKMGRLDYFLTSADILNVCSKCEINFGYRTDHSVVFFEFKFTENAKGPGYWKFNSSLLHDPAYVAGAKKTIQDTVNQYRTQRGQDVPNFSIGYRLFWETLKMEIRGFSIRFSAQKKKKNKDLEKSITKAIETLDGKLDRVSIEQRDQEVSRLQEIRKIKMRGTQIRSKAKWVEKGESNSKFFCSLEKRNFVNKTISRLKDGEIEYKKDKDILDKAKTFYHNLYTTKLGQINKCQMEKFLTPNDVKLSQNDKDYCEQELSKKECLAALKAMSNEKSPGLDGFVCEFYKFFWNDISEYLILAFQEAFQSGEMSMIQREGLITCIPKPSKDRSDIKNWRPITLLNIDYKILSSALANRFKNVLPSIISTTQKGFLKGRFIGENTRLLYDVLHEAEKRQIPGLLMMVDFEKAFDSIEWSFLQTVMYHYNFGPNIIHWINTLYKDISSRIINNGHMSDRFKISRGVRQGDPLSPLLFILAVEPLATAVKNNKNIKGIEIDNIISLLSQYADDTFFTLDGSEKSLYHTIQTLRDFEKVSGLKINLDKTKLLWFGSKKKCKMKYCEEFKLDWSEGNFKLLGIIFNVETQLMPKLNFDKAKDCVEKIFNSWEHRNLTLYGKITIIKSLATAKINHIISVIPIPDKTVKELEKSFHRFLWNGKKGNVKHSTLILDYNEGGLKMLDITSFIKSLKATWVKRLLNTKGIWQDLASNIIGVENTKFVFELDNKSIESICKTVHNPFWKQILMDWAAIQNNHRYMVLWKNQNITANKKPIYYKTLCDSGITNACHLLNHTRTAFLTYNELKQKCPRIDITFIQYHGLLQAIPKHWKESNIGKVQINIQSNLQKVLKAEKPSRFVYSLLLKKKGTKPIADQTKWETSLGINPKWEEIYTLPQKTTKDKKLRVLQYKISQRRIATNQFLEKIKIKTNAHCTFCKGVTETIEHLFYDCKYSRNILTFIKNRINQNTLFNFPDNCAAILLGHKIEDISLNYVLLCYKYFLYRCKYQEVIPEVKHFQLFFKEKINVEKQAYLSEWKLNQYLKKWQYMNPSILMN